MTRSSRAHVTAVVVVAEDLTYLPSTLTALAAQTTVPDRIVIVRAGGAAGPVREAVDEAGLAAEVVDAEAADSFGGAVGRAVEQAGVDTAWLWLLHDDSAPEPGALAALAREVETGHSIAVAGCKQVAWHHPDRLVSVGVQYTRDIQRYTGVEDGEVDQGQHDDREDVDAVGTAGMLIDTELFRALGGPDPALGPFGDGRDISRRARLAGRRVVVVPRAVVRHARASYLGLRRHPDREPDPRQSFRERRVAVLHSRLVEAPALAVPLVVLAAMVAGPVRAVGRLVTKELRGVGDELVAPLVACAGWGSVWRARRTARATRTGSARRLRPLQATWRDVARVRRDRRLQAAAQRRSVRAPSELEMRERAALGTRRRLVLAAVLLAATLVAAVTLAPVAFAGPLIGGALLPSDVELSELWRAAGSPWLASGDGYGVPPDPFLAMLGVLSLATGGPLGTPVWLTVSIVLVTAIPLAALTGWFAAGAATRSLSLRAWAALIWALGPPLALAIGSGRLGAVVAHVLLPLVALGVVRAFGLDRRDVVISGLVGAPRVATRTATAPAARVRQQRLEALAAVSDEPTIQLTRVIEGDASEGEAAETAETPERDEGATPHEDVDAPVIASNTAEPYEPGDEETASIVTRPSGVGSVGAAAAAGLFLAAAAAGAPVLLPAGLLCLLVLAVMLGRRSSLAAGRSRLLLVAVPPVVLLGPLVTYALGVEGGWRLLLSGPGAATTSPENVPLLTLLGWPQSPPDIGVEGVPQWLALAASVTVLAAAVVALTRAAGLARGVRLAWLVVAVGAAAAVLAPLVDVALVHLPDGTSTIARGWAGPGTSLVMLGLVMATCTASGGLRASLGGRSFGWRQLGLAVVSVVLVGGVVLAAIGWTTMLRGDMLVLQTRTDDPVPAIGDEQQASEARSRVLALWVTSSGVVDADLWRSAGPQLTETSSAVELAELERTEPDPASAALQTVVAGLATGTITDAAPALAEHAVGVVVVPPVDSVLTGGAGDDVSRSRLVAQLDGVLGLDRVTENDSGVIWRVSTEDAEPARAVLLGADGVAARVPADVVAVGTRLDAQEEAVTLVLAERAGSGWRAWIDGQPLRAVTHGWQQAFEVPAGSSGELVVRFDAPLATLWRVLIAVTFVAATLIALPTRRRRLDQVEES